MRNGGVPVTSKFQIVVQSQTSQAVLISNMSVRVLKRLPKLDGTEVYCPTAGTANFRLIGINLDATPPKFTYRSGGKSIPFGFTLSDGETEIFDVTATTQQAYYTYEVVLDVIVAGHTQEIPVTDNGKPFQTTAGLATNSWGWDYQKTWDKWDYSNSGAPQLISSVPAGQPFPR